MDRLISVIVPVYKVEKYLDRCVESIVNQSYTNLEIILVDDGSPDNCPQMCDDWALKDERIIVLHQKNGGLSSARNAGIDKSTGEYISFVDSDDYVHRDFVKALFMQITKYDSDISSVGFKKVAENDPDITADSYGKEIIVYSDSVSAIAGLISPDGFRTTAWNKLYKRELFDDIRFPVGRKTEDLGTIYLLLDRCDKVTYNPDIYYYYFQRSDSIMHRPGSDLFVDFYELAIERYFFIRNKYGYIYENEKYTVESLLYCLALSEGTISDINAPINTLDRIYQNDKSVFATKDLIRFGLLKFDYRLFCFLFSNYHHIKQKINQFLKSGYHVFSLKKHKH